MITSYPWTEWVTCFECYIHFRQILISQRRNLPTQIWGYFLPTIVNDLLYCQLMHYNGFNNKLLLPFCGHEIFLPRISLHHINFSRNDFPNFRFQTLKFEPIRNEDVLILFSVWLEYSLKEWTPKSSVGS